MSDIKTSETGTPIDKKDPVKDNWEHKGKEKLKLLQCFQCGSKSFFEVVNVTEKHTIPPQKPRVFKCLQCETVQHASQMSVSQE